MKHIDINIKDMLYEEMKVFCDEYGVTVSDFIRMSIRSRLTAEYLIKSRLTNPELCAVLDREPVYD